MEFIKPTLLVSRCLTGDPCRYDGTGAKSTVLDLLTPYVNLITVCPETEIGLPTPRDTLRLVAPNDDSPLTLQIMKTGEDHTQSMEIFSKDFLNKIKDKAIHGILLKSSSPSCGLKDTRVYRGIEKGPAIRKNASGLFTEEVLKTYTTLPIEHEGRLTNYNIREQFLTRIFALARLDQIKKTGTMKDLIQFHSVYKYLLMAYSPGYLKKLGKVVANHDKKSLEDVLEAYEPLLNKALSATMKPMRNVNMLLHLFGYFSKDLTPKEKAYFLDNIESYSRKEVPFSVPLSIIHTWVLRFGEPYLMEQIIFEPYPNALRHVTDSGKGLNK